MCVKPMENQRFRASWCGAFESLVSDSYGFRSVLSRSDLALASWSSFVELVLMFVLEVFGVLMSVWVGSLRLLRLSSLDR